MHLEEHKQETSQPIQCCGSCVYWRQTSQFEGICTEGLSGTIDTTEVRWSCKRWSSLLSAYDLMDDED